MRMHNAIMCECSSNINPYTYKIMRQFSVQRSNHSFHMQILNENALNPNIKLKKYMMFFKKASTKFIRSIKSNQKDKVAGKDSN